MPGIVCSSRAKQLLGLLGMHTVAVMRRMRNSVARLGTRYQLFFGSDPRSLGCNSDGDTRAPDFTNGRRRAATSAESSHAVATKRRRPRTGLRYVDVTSTPEPVVACGRHWRASRARTAQLGGSRSVPPRSVGRRSAANGMTARRRVQSSSWPVNRGTPPAPRRGRPSARDGRDRAAIWGWSQARERIALFRSTWASSISANGAARVVPRRSARFLDRCSARGDSADVRPSSRRRVVDASRPLSALRSGRCWSRRMACSPAQPAAADRQTFHPFRGSQIPQVRGSLRRGGVASCPTRDGALVSLGSVGERNEGHRLDGGGS